MPRSVVRLRSVETLYTQDIMAINTESKSRAACALVISTLVLLGGCAPSLASQVSTVGSLARVRDLALLHEGEVEPDSSAAAIKLLKQPVNADAAVRIALLNNRELRAQLRELGISAGQLITAGLVANPTFEVEFLPERDSKYELRAEYDLTSLIMAPLRRAAAQADVEAARLSAAGAVVDLGYQVRVRFYALQATTQRLALAQQSLDALAASRDAARALLDAGNIKPLDAASQIAAYERARVDVARMELEVAERREAVQRVLGLYGQQTTWEVKNALPSESERLPMVDDLERRALEANLDLRAAHKRLDGLAKQSGITSTRAWLPEVVGDVHALRVKDEDGGRDVWRWGAGFSVQVPLFDRAQGRLQGIASQFDAALERYQGLAVNLRSAARDARNRLVSTHARARQYQTVILPAQRVVLEQTLLQYNAMQIGVFQLISARRELFDVELAYVDMLRDFWSAMAEVDALGQGRVVRVAEATNANTFTASTGADGGH
ncbi:MAG: Copper tolerance protein [Pseudomonadota bacterium]